MAARTFNAASLVALPRTTAEGTLVLITKVITTARAEKRLPRSLDEPLGELALARDALHDALRVPAPAGQSSETTTREADLVIDTAWGAFHAWTGGWSLNKLCPHAEGVAQIRAQVFADGLKFLTLRYAEEWAASDTRLATLEAPAARAVIKALGGESFLVNLRAAHDAYGRVLGVTEVPKPAAERADVRAAMDAALEALRVYVLAAAYVGGTKPARNAALAQRLLVSVIDWAPPTVSKGENPKKPEPVPVDEPKN